MKHATSAGLFAVLLAASCLITPAMRGQRNQQGQPQMQQAQQPMQQVQQPMQQPQQNNAQMQGAQAAVSYCANKPLCYEGNDFVATVTEFRTSTAGNGAKILDAMVHFQNKTNQPISLGYVDQSGGAIDDMGNRFILNTWNGGVRGMGVVSGNNMDPKFTLPAGGGGDARFELWWAPYGKLAGVNYEMELSIREMNRVEGNQWTLGDETLVHYSGLANGTGVPPVSGISAGGGTTMGNGAMATPATTVGNVIGNYTQGQTNTTATNVQTMVTAGQACPPGTAPSNAAGRVTNVANAAGAQNQTANNAISNASSAISSIGSLFGKKKQQQAQANQAAATTPCVATTNGNAMAASPAATPAVQQANPLATNPLATNPAAARTTNQPNGVAANGKAAQIGTAATKPAVTNASLKQAAPATATPAKPKPATTTTPAKKPATAPTTTSTGSGG